MTQHALLAAALIALVADVAGAPTLARRTDHMDSDKKWAYDRCDKLLGPAAWPQATGAQACPALASVLRFQMITIARSGRCFRDETPSEAQSPIDLCGAVDLAQIPHPDGTDEGACLEVTYARRCALRLRVEAFELTRAGRSWCGRMGPNLFSPNRTITYARSFNAQAQRFDYGTVNMVLDIEAEVKLTPKDADSDLKLLTCSLPVHVGRQQGGVTYGETHVVYPHFCLQPGSSCTESSFPCSAHPLEAGRD